MDMVTTGGGGGESSSKQWGGGGGPHTNLFLQCCYIAKFGNRYHSMLYTQRGKGNNTETIFRGSPAL